MTVGSRFFFFKEKNEESKEQRRRARKNREESETEKSQLFPTSHLDAPVGDNLYSLIY